MSHAVSNHGTRQDWSTYTLENHDVWRILFDSRMQALETTGSQVFLDGAASIGLERSHVPDLNDVNKRLAAMTGWAAVPVDGFIPAREFFSSLALRRFPTTVTVRPREKLEYLEEPDIFHDVFGHVPLHADPIFADYLAGFGQLAARAVSEEQTTCLARLFWFTVEFGLIRERGRLRIYGSGLISSAADAANALGDECVRKDFDLEEVMGRDFNISDLQPELFVVDSFDQLFEATRDVEMLLFR